MIHTINIGLHVICGTIALIIGILAIAFNRRAKLHKRLGRIFLYLLAVVVVTGFVGWLFFRSDPFLLMLTLLSGYVGFSGWRAMKLREKRATPGDGLISIIVLGCGLFYLYWLLNSEGYWSPTVIYSTVGALILVTVYDLVKIVALHQPLRTWWRYEHIYKMISAFSAILSAFAGTVLPNSFKPYSQVAPSGLGVLLIIIFITIEAQRRIVATTPSAA